MATRDRGGNRGGNRNRGGRNNNADGRTQFGGMMTMARDSPLAAAAVIGSAVAAGLFLWSRRNELSDQIKSLSEQISDWREQRSSDNDPTAAATSPDEPFVMRSGSGSGSGDRRRRTQAEISEEALTVKEIEKTS